MKNLIGTLRSSKAGRIISTAFKAIITAPFIMSWAVLYMVVFGVVEFKSRVQ